MTQFESRKYAFAFRAVQVAAVLLFLGRGYEFLVFDAPFRTLLWDEDWMRPVVEAFGGDWTTYVRSPRTDANITTAVRIFGVLYIMCAVVALFVRRVGRVGAKLLWLGAAGLLFLAVLFWKEKFFAYGQLLEYALQVGTPLLLHRLTYGSGWTERTVLVTKTLIALTFICHGLYAVGYYPRPANYLGMVLSAFPLSNDGARTFLNVAAYLDFAAAIGLFLPGRGARVALLYCVLWGFLTSFARIYTNFYPDFWMETLRQWVHPFLVRTPHFLVPLAVWLILPEMSKVSKTLNV